MFVKDACTILSPSRLTTEKQNNEYNADKSDHQSGLLIYKLGQTGVSYTGPYCLRPDGYNSFEVIFLNPGQNAENSQAPILSTIQIGCLV